MCTYPRNNRHIVVLYKDNKQLPSCGKATKQLILVATCIRMDHPHPIEYLDEGWWCVQGAHTQWKRADSLLMVLLFGDIGGRGHLIRQEGTGLETQ